MANIQPVQNQVVTETTDQSLLTVLVNDGRLTADQAKAIGAVTTAETLEDELITRRLVSPDDILQAYATLYAIPFVRLKSATLKPEIVAIVPEIIARRYDIIAYDKQDEIVFIAIGSPKRMKSNQQVGLLHRLQNELRIKIAPAFAPISDIRSAYALYAKTGAPTNSAAQLAAASITQPNYPAVNLIGRTITQDVLKKFPVEIVEKYRIFPFLQTTPQQLSIAVFPPVSNDTLGLIDFIQNNNDIQLALYQTDEASFRYALSLYGVTAPADLNPPVVPTVDPAAIATPPAITPESTTVLPGEKMAENTPVAPIAPPAQTAPEIRPPAVAVEINQNEIKGIGDKLGPVQFDVSRAAQPNNQTIITPQVKSSENNLDSFLGQPIATVQQLVDTVKTGNIPRVVGAAVALAVTMRASDIHIEASKTQLRLRFRVDGELMDVLLLPIGLLPQIVSRIKILSELKIDENRIPQDGRFDVTYQNREIDLRVSTLPTVHGEKVVLRILDKATGILSLDEMGLDGANRERLNANVTKPYGIVLATGPTGSGKSTTLYALLQQISRPEVNIVTLEDPVEYELKGINQTQIKPKIGFTFAEGLRSILRQDPNVIMVGEIRDKETAEMATHSALTGHLVLSTLHTNTAAGAIPRLINMGIEPFLITSSINAIVGQRLVRKICDNCKAPEAIPPAVIEEIKAELTSPTINPQLLDTTKWQFFRGKGCDRCTNGYKGRIGLYEVLVMTETLENLAVKKEPESVLEEQAIKDGMITMKQDGLLKVLRGLTTVEEIMKATTV